MQTLLAEYLTNGDVEEASRCLMELNVPYYHHELVKRALVTAAGDSKDHNAPLLLALLSKLAHSGAINQVRLEGMSSVTIPHSIICCSLVTSCDKGIIAPNCSRLAMRRLSYCAFAMIMSLCCIGAPVSYGIHGYL